MKNDVFKEVLSSNSLNWKQEAEELARTGIPFVLVGFKYAHHKDYFERLSMAFALESRFDQQERAYFWKK
jgi:hypothetical protein